MNRHEQLIYIAGLVDGEGCILVSKLLQLFFVISMTDREPIARFSDLFECSITTTKRGQNKRQYRCTLCSRRALEALTELEPFMLCKQEQARATIRYAEHFAGHSSLDMVGRAHLRVELCNMKKHNDTEPADPLIRRMRRGRPLREVRAWDTPRRS